MQFSELVAQLSDLVITCTDNPVEITGVAAVEAARPGQLSYIEGGKFLAHLRTTQASALILPDDARLQTQADDRQIAWLSTKEPRLAFARAIALFYRPYRPAPGIHPTAVIDPSVKLGKDIYIGAYSVIGAGAIIGDQVCIHPHVVVYPEARIGSGTVLHSHCTIHERSCLGENCVIHSGAAIGSEGFGFVPVPTGWYKMEQSGYTILEDGVEVGCHSAIDRPAVGETRIGRNTKIDNLVQVGHGCQIGQACALAGQAGLAGGVELGNRVILAGQSGVANQAKIGDGVIASAQTGIANDIKAGEVVSGSPALPHRLYLKVAAIQAKLPDIYQWFKKQQKAEQ